MVHNHGHGAASCSSVRIIRSVNRDSLCDGQSKQTNFLSLFGWFSINLLLRVVLNSSNCMWFFYFGQSLYRKVLELCLSYREDKNFSLNIRMFAAFVFSPSNLMNLVSKWSRYRCKILKLWILLIILRKYFLLAARLLYCNVETISSRD